MTKTKVLLAVAFVVTLAAGVAVGLSVSRLEHRPPGPSWLSAELDLSRQQRDQMRQIWSDVIGTEERRRWEQRKALAQARDDAIVALLTEEQRPQYEKILEDFSRNMEELRQDRKRAFEQAVARTKEILTPEQAAKYDELMKKPWGRGPGEKGGPPSGGPPPPWGKGHRSRPGPQEPNPDEKDTPRGGE